MHCRVNAWTSERASGPSPGEAMHRRKEEDAFLGGQIGRMDFPQSCGIKRKRTGLETEDESEEFVRTVLGAEALRYSPEDNFEGSHEEREIFSSFFPREEESCNSSEDTGTEDVSLEDSIESRDLGTEDVSVEDSIESRGVSSTGTAGNNTYTSSRFGIAAVRDGSAGQKIWSPMITFREGSFDVAKDGFTDKKDRRFSGAIYNSMTIRKDIRTMDSTLEEIKSLQKLGRMSNDGARSGREWKADHENGNTKEISSKDILHSECNECGLRDNNASAYKGQAEFEKLKRKTIKDDIMQREQDRRIWGKVPQEDIVGNRFCASQAKRLNQRLTSPVVESSEGGMLLSRYVDGNAAGITACDRFSGDGTTKNLGHRASTSVIPSTKAGVLVRQPEVGLTETKENNMVLMLANQNFACKIPGVTELYGKDERKTMPKRGQTVSLAVSSKERQTGKKSELSGLRKSLRERAKDHLLAAGWKIKFKPRTGRDYQDAVYVSPWGSSFWSLPKAWSALRQRLDANSRKDVIFSNSMQTTNEKMLRGKGSCFWSGLKDTLMQLDNDKQNLDESTVAGNQVSEVNPFMSMLLTEDLSLLKRKKKDKCIEDIDRNDRDKEHTDKNDKFNHYIDEKDNNSKSSVKGIKNGQILPFVEPQYLLREGKRGTNLDGLCITSAETQICDQRILHGNLQHAGEQRTMHGNLSHDWKLRNVQPKLSCAAELSNIYGEQSNVEEQGNTHKKFLHASELRCIHGKPLIAGEQRGLPGRLSHTCDGKPLHAGNRKLLHPGDERRIHGKLLNAGDERSMNGKLLNAREQRSMNGKILNAAEQRHMHGKLLHATNDWSMNGKLLMSASEQRSINGKILSIHGKTLHSGNQSSIQEKLLHASDQRNMNGKIPHVSGPENHFFTQSKAGGKIVQQHQPAEPLQDGHYGKDCMKGPGISQKENPEHRGTRLPSTKNLYMGMEKQHVLCTAADLKASSLINSLQKLSGRKSNYPETGRVSSEPEAGQVGRNLNEPRVGQLGRKSNEPRANKEPNELQGCRILSDPQVGQTVRKFNESKAGRKFDEPHEAQSGRKLIELEEMSNEPEARGNYNEQSVGQTSRKADKQKEGRRSTEPVSDTKSSDLQEGQTGREPSEPQENRACIEPRACQEDQNCVQPQSCQEGKKTNDLQSCPENGHSDEPQACSEVRKTNELQVTREIEGSQTDKTGILNEPEAGRECDEVLAGRGFNEPHAGRVSNESNVCKKSHELQADREGGKNNEPRAGRKSKGPQVEKCLKICKTNGKVRVNRQPMLRKVGSSIVDDDDDDILLSSLIKKRKCGLRVAKGLGDFPNTSRTVAGKSDSLHGKKKKKHKGGCVLLVRGSGKGESHSSCDKSLSSTNRRTVLSWLIDVGAVSENEMVQYLNMKSKKIMKDGWVTRDGILCKCCNRMLTISNFKAHAGSKVPRPCSNIFLESGKSLTTCQIQAWSAEYKSRKGGMRIIEVDESDRNDDACGLCGDGGNLICCDKCPSTFHQDCLALKDIPEGNWYCPSCTCAICGTVGHDEETDSTSTMLTCDQCKHKYHKRCFRERGIQAGGSKARNSGFCQPECEKVSAGLHQLLGISNPIEEGFSWTLLRCIDECKKACSGQRLALMAECNAKLAVALAVMEECFEPMVDPRTGIDMIPHVVYNSGSNFNRLNYQGFYTMVLEKGSELISVASIRIHGDRLAEMPLIGTCHQYRRQGMCRRLVNAIEEILMSLKVEKLILSAIPDLLETWTVVFGFKPLEDSHKEEIRNTSMMMFPGTTLLQKTIYKPEMIKTDETVGKHADQLRCSNCDDLDAQAQRDSAGVSVPKKTQTESVSSVPGDTTDANTRIQSIAPMLFPETQDILNHDKDIDKKLASEEERSVSQCANGQAHIESPIHLEAEQRIISTEVSSDILEGDILETFAYRLSLGAQHIDDAAMDEDSAGLNSAHLDTAGTTNNGDYVCVVEESLNS